MDINDANIKSQHSDRPEAKTIIKPNSQESITKCRNRGNVFKGPVTCTYVIYQRADRGKDMYIHNCTANDHTECVWYNKIDEQLAVAHFQPTGADELTCYIPRA